MKKPKPPPNLFHNLVQFALFLVVLGCILIESPDITWGEVAIRGALILLAGYGFVKLEEGARQNE